MTPTILTDKSRLQEIYDLRVAAWENSDRKDASIKEKYPDGWSETIDLNAYHFVIFNEEDNIVASARISIHESIEELPFPNAFREFILPLDRPFAFYSRLVVHPDYRSSFFFKKLDGIRLKFLKENKIPFAVATCIEKRFSSITKIGYKNLGKTRMEYLDEVEEYALILFLNDINL